MKPSLVALLLCLPIAKPVQSDSVITAAGVTLADGIEGAVKRLGPAAVISGGDAGTYFQNVCYCNDAECVHFEASEMGLTTIVLNRETKDCARTKSSIATGNGVHLGMTESDFVQRFSFSFKTSGKGLHFNRHERDEVTPSEMRLMTARHTAEVEYDAETDLDATFQDGKLIFYRIFHGVSF